eukprot:TRINITY_DN2541_c0_g1_i1.p1 TRINITY_DN2541_c0_g1~~TRINITY_DN2541_c0_g1_i1.p1  ORF type:complete len:304 (+),score=114.62 TRINITY_DN2541_c0_g1_i1:86-913(+)
MKLIAIDLDGTLLNTSKQISQINIDSIRRGVTFGFKIVIASGRPTSSLNYFASVLGVDCYLLSYNGSKCFDTLENNRTLIFEENLLEQTINKVIEFSQNNRLVMNFYVEPDTIYVVNWLEKQHLIDGFINVNNAKFTFIDNYEQLLNKTIIKCLLVLDNHNDREEMIERISELSKEANVIRTHCKNNQVAQYYVEILPSQVNKAFGLNQLCNYLKINMNEVVAFGDDDNDQEMLREVGLGICMAQGSVVAKSSSKKISQFTNDQDAVGHEIDLLI